MDAPAHPHRSNRWLLCLPLFLATLSLVVISSTDYGVTWDEPPYFVASDLHINWIGRALKHGTRGEWREVINDKEIEAAWRWNPYHVPHPPFSRIVSGLLKVATAPLLDEISAYRLGPALFFCLLVTIMFRWIGDLFGVAAGLFSALALILIPNLFAYSHFAVTDMPLAAMWFTTSYCFYKGLGDWRWSIALGVIWGLAISTKFPALLTSVPLILWAHIFHRKDYVNNLFAMLFLAPMIVVATQPYLWHQTGLRGLEFLYEGISRGYRPETSFGVFFDNQVFFSHQLPRYYPFLLVAVTTPEPILALALIGVLLSFSKTYRATVLLFVLNAVFVLLLGAMPGAVLHDGVRQLLSSLPFIAALAGIGFYMFAAWFKSFLASRDRLCIVSNSHLKICAMLFLIFGFSPALDLYLTHPYQLSFYNRFVGGVRGAYERGLETTYFLEALTPDLIRSLNEQLPNNAAVNATFANTMLDYYQKKGLLRQDLKVTAIAPYDYLLLLNRRSALSVRERNMIDSAATPEFSIRLAGVPLVLGFNLTKFRQD